MNIAIIGFTKIKYMPYLNFYLDNLDKKKHMISIFYWERDSTGDVSLPSEFRTYPFKFSQDDNVPKYKKIKGFIAFRRNVISFLKKGNYDKIIVLSTYPALLLSNLLLKQYRKRYIFDFRDLTFEGYSFFRMLVGRLVRGAEATFVSSHGFLKYLPNERIFITHNLPSERHAYDIVPNDHTADPIRIRYWGLIRDLDINKQIIHHLCNDTRYELHYHGREQSIAIKLKECCEQSNAQNVFFHGEYSPDEKLVFAVSSDIILNMYSNNVLLAPAMGNKYYDGMVFRLPQICTIDTLMGKCVEEHGIGITLNPADDSFAERIYRYYYGINWEEFYSNCESTLSSVKNENGIARNYVNRI